jgi:hypothetical protein
MGQELLVDNIEIEIVFDTKPNLTAVIKTRGK